MLDQSKNLGFEHSRTSFNGILYSGNLAIINEPSGNLQACSHTNGHASGGFFLEPRSDARKSWTLGVPYNGDATVDIVGQMAYRRQC